MGVLVGVRVPVFVAVDRGVLVRVGVFVNAVVTVGVGLLCGVLVRVLVGVFVFAGVLLGVGVSAPATEATHKSPQASHRAFIGCTLACPARPGSRHRRHCYSSGLQDLLGGMDQAWESASGSV